MYAHMYVTFNAISTVDPSFSQNALVHPLNFGLIMNGLAFKATTSPISVKIAIMVFLCMKKDNLCLTISKAVLEDC